MPKRFPVPLFVLVLALGVWIPTARAQDALLVALDDLTPREVRTEGFTLARRTTLRVEAVGAEARTNDWDGDGRRSERYWWPGEAWILNARTRDEVWRLSTTDTERLRDGRRSFDGTVTLPAGDYEAYYASYAGTWSYDGWDEWDRVASRLKEAINVALDRDTRHRRGRRYDGEFVENGAYHDFRLVIRGDGDALNASDRRHLRETYTEHAFVSLTDLWDDAYEEAGFILDRPTDVELYALGELRDDESYDYGWLINADTRERVWAMDYHHSEHAGGSDKNRVVRLTLALPAGRYAAFFVTDGSHSAEEWNTTPPRDPAFWGLTLRVTDPADAAHVQPFAYERVPARDAFVSLTRQRDDAVASEGFTLKRPMNVRVYALGEGSDGEMYDFGWIVDVRTHRRVWEMTYDATEHAGGARKNRRADAVLPLDAGSYVAYYVTDGSHAYRDWNASPPIGGDDWGLTLLAADGPLDRSLIAPYDDRDDPTAVARIVRVRNHERERVRFTLDRDTRVRVYALGEGSDGEMYDYGWIEEAGSGRVVWDMTYDATEHAGGARKNRAVDTTLHLDAGDYVLHYRTDGSHAFGDWNDAPPHDPVHWGITLYEER